MTATIGATAQHDGEESVVGMTRERRAHLARLLVDARTESGLTDWPLDAVDAALQRAERVWPTLVDALAAAAGTAARPDATPAEMCAPWASTGPPARAVDAAKVAVMAGRGLECPRHAGEVAGSCRVCDRARVRRPENFAAVVERGREAARARRGDP